MFQTECSVYGTPVVAVAEDALGLGLCAPEKPAMRQKAVIKMATLSFMFSFRLWVCSQSTSRGELALLRSVRTGRKRRRGKSARCFPARRVGGVLDAGGRIS